MEIKVYRNLMGANAEWAAKTRELLAGYKLKMINIIGSPGCGKTSLLESVARQNKGKLRFGVLEGDVETTRDAERLHALDIPVSQLITDGACHLEAKLVHYALKEMPLGELDLVVVENVGNLVCPAEFDIGEDMKIAVLSVTEGEDKPVKYPLLFRESSLAVVTKVDLLPYLDFDLEQCLAYIRQVNAGIPILQVASRKDEGVAAVVDALKLGV